MIWRHFFCRELLLGIACNMHIKNLHLDLSNNDLQAQGGQVLGSSIGNISSITSLDISNNSKLLQNIIFMTISIAKACQVVSIALFRNSVPDYSAALLNLPYIFWNNE